MRRAFSSAVFAVHDETVLLILHKALGLWLPSGGELEFKLHFDDIETPLEAAKRELKEETQLDGIFVRLSDMESEPEGYLGYGEHPAGAKGLHMNFNFLAFVKSQDVIGDGSFTDHHWFRFEEAENLERTTLSVKQYVRMIALIVQDQRVLARLALAQM
jgi:8-oxo-dGTP diphosphatase